MNQEVANLYGMQKVKKLFSNREWARKIIKTYSGKSEDHKLMDFKSLRIDL